MENRIALIGIVVSDHKNIDRLNHILSDYGQYMLGRMGLPHQRNDIALISIGIEAPQDVINALSGKIGRLEGISSQVIYAKC
ncbi:MAG: TM1266 family iron-only hydrogenase system putative regulator [Lachnospiraceae bacterium]